MDWLCERLEQDRATALGAPGPAAPLVQHQQEVFGLEGAAVRLPEYFRGPADQARVCFLGPHAALDPAEPAPTVNTGCGDYLHYYSTATALKRDPYGHYTAITEGRPWLAAELVPWPCLKSTAMKLMTPAVVDPALETLWRLLAESPVEVLVLTGNDALQWVLPRLGRRYGKLTGITRLHGQVLGRFPLPGAPDRYLTVVASFHWSPEMPLFVRKVPGLAGLTPAEAISTARRMVGEAIQARLSSGSELAPPGGTRG